MVFMGSEKYPAENAYDSFVEDHGGFCNAMTDGEYTTYQFGIDSDFFSEAFDIFAHCFISPKLSPASAEKEICAIESEFQLAAVSDSARQQEILCCNTNSGHFYRKFSWGNVKSLRDTPRENGIDIISRLRQFYETYYKPENMKLVVVVPLEVDISCLLTDVFSRWDSPDYRLQESDNKSRLLPPVVPYGGLPFQDSEPLLVRYQPIKNIHKLVIFWV